MFHFTWTIASLGGSVNQQSPYEEEFLSELRSLGEAAELNESIRDVLLSSRNHVSAASAVRNLGYDTSEASVRRWRDNNTDHDAVRAEAAAENLEEPEDAEVIEAKYDDLRRTHLRTLRKLEETKVKKAELVQAVFDAAGQAAAALELKPTPKPGSSGTPRRRSPEVAVAVLADWQLAKVTPSYNSEVCEERIEKLAQHILKITEIQRADHPVRDLQVWGLGDLIEGELIFPGQHWLIDASLYEQVCVSGPRILGNFLRTMLANFDSIEFHGVIGNHGRLGGRASKDMNAESNGDRMLYRITQQLLAHEPRITWSIPDGPNERNWYDIATIGNYSSLLLHGDQFRGQSGMPWYGLQKKVGGWKMGAIETDFDDVYFGHYHQPTRVTLNNVTARCSGSTESHNTYAQEQLAAVGKPSQPLMFVHPGDGRVTAEYTVWL